MRPAARRFEPGRDRQKGYGQEKASPTAGVRLSHCLVTLPLRPRPSRPHWAGLVDEKQPKTNTNPTLSPARPFLDEQVTPRPRLQVTVH